MIHTFSLATTFKEWWQEVLDWLYDFFNPDLSGFENFDFGKGEMLNIRIIIFGIFIGVLLAAAYMVYIKNVIGAFVRKLLAESCLSSESAKTLEELGYSKNPFVRYALRGSILRSTVCHFEELSDASEEKIVKSAKKKKSSETTRYYIREEKKYAAEMRFRNSGSGWPTFFFVLLVSIMCIFIIFAFLPQILRFFDNTVSIFSAEGNTLK